MIGLGLSSGSLPAATATELAAAVVAGGGTGVDLRIGKGHRWEEAGVAAGLRAIGAAGVEVFFVGTGARLGQPFDLSTVDAVPTAVPVKVFCVENPDAAVVADQVGAAGRELWVETHRGGPDPAALAALAATAGVGVVLDLLGLVESGGADPAVLADLAPHVRAVQVKGVERTAAGHRHRPLRPDDLDVVAAVLAAGAPVRAMTVESRAGAPERDLAVLAGLVPKEG